MIAGEDCMMSSLHTKTHTDTRTTGGPNLDLKAPWDCRDYIISIQIYKAWRQIGEESALCHQPHLTIRVHQRVNQSPDVCPKVTTQKTLHRWLPGRLELHREMLWKAVSRNVKYMWFVLSHKESTDSALLCLQELRADIHVHSYNICSDW